MSFNRNQYFKRKITIIKLLYIIFYKNIKCFKNTGFLIYELNFKIGSWFSIINTRYDISSKHQNIGKKSYFLTTNKYVNNNISRTNKIKQKLVSKNNPS